MMTKFDVHTVIIRWEFCAKRKKRGKKEVKKEKRRRKEKWIRLWV